jgi:hypothetical protein
VRAARILYAIAALVVFGGLLVAVFGVRTRYACQEDGVAFTTSAQEADSVCNPPGLSPLLAPRETPFGDHRWPQRVTIVAVVMIVAVILLWVGDSKAAAAVPSDSPSAAA